MSANNFNCNVLNCGNGKCIHRITDEHCPYCDNLMIEVITTGVKFCSSHPSICDYEIDADSKDIKRLNTPMKDIKTLSILQIAAICDLSFQCLEKRAQKTDFPPLYGRRKTNLFGNERHYKETDILAYLKGQGITPFKPDPKEMTLAEIALEIGCGFAHVRKLQEKDKTNFPRVSRARPSIHGKARTVELFNRKESAPYIKAQREKHQARFKHDNKITLATSQDKPKPAISRGLDADLTRQFLTGFRPRSNNA
jgi:hypothetical protein